MSIRRHELTDAQWNLIEPLFPKYRTGRPPKYTNRQLLNAILWICKTGAPWRDLPSYYAPWKTVYTRLSRWHHVEILEDIFIALNDSPNLENLRLDSTVVSAHQHSATAKKGGSNSEENLIGSSRGGKSTKIHALVDALGNPIIFHVTAGNVNDSPVAIKLLEQVELQDVNVIADRAYGGNATREYISKHGGQYTIPPKINVREKWEVDWWLYKERHVIECFFNKLKHFRRIATRYEKTPEIFQTFLYLSLIHI